MRAMPSPISTTVPTSTDSAFPRKPLIWALMISVISDDVVAISLPVLLALQLLAERVQLGAQRCVDEVIAHLHGGAADELGLDLELGLDALAGRSLEAADERRPLRLGQGHRRGDARLRDARALVREVAVGRGDRADQREPAALDEHRDKGGDGR